MTESRQATDHILEPARRVPVTREVDVLVVGGGLAGVTAAVAAARSGASVLLLERTSFLGGSAAGAFPGSFGMLEDLAGQVIVGGLVQEMIALLQEKGGARQELWGLPPTMERQIGLEEYYSRHPRPPSMATRIDFEALKFVCDDLTRKAGVETMFDVWVADAIVQDSAIQGVIAQSKSGRFAVRAKVVVDASGDADIAASAGAPFQLGSESDGRTQPVTVTFLLSNVDVERAQDYERQDPENRGFARELAQARENGEIVDFPLDRLSAWRPMFSPGIIWLNATRVLGVNGTDPEQISQGLREGRRQVEMVVRFLRRYIPGFQNAHLLYTAPLLGVRETRRIVGEYVLTEEDEVAGRRFDDVVSRRVIVIDVHNPAGSGFKPITLGDATFFDIPYRCLLPQKIDNLLVAGRCISTTHTAHGATRSMVGCASLGQAAGTAAGLSVRRGETPRQLSVKALQASLREQGALPGPPPGA